MLQVEPPNPVHMATSPTTRWTTVNFAEAIQGVQKPLSWHVWDLGVEVSLRKSFGALGVLARDEVPTPENSDKRTSGIFYGRAAGNVSTFRELGDRMPGSSGDVLEEKLFGNEPDPGGPARKPLIAYRRYPIVAVRMPWALRRTARQLPEMRPRYRQWWQREVLDAPPAGLAAAQALYRASSEEFIKVGVPHAIASMMASSFLDQLGDLAELACGERPLASDLATGYGLMEETQLLEDLWSASHGRLELDQVIRRHGYHGPDEGDLSARSWREERKPLEAIFRGYQRSAIANPRERERTQLDRRRAAEARVLAGLSAARRPHARLIMKLAAAFIPKRELGKASFLHTMDAARCAARVGGAQLAELALAGRARRRLLSHRRRVRCQAGRVDPGGGRRAQGAPRALPAAGAAAVLVGSPGADSSRVSGQRSRAAGGGHGAVGHRGGGGPRHRPRTGGPRPPRRRPRAWRHPRLRHH
jgi:pyruvate,water dikinase